MGRLSLILADSDTYYTTKLEKYLIVNHPFKFEIFSFSSFDSLIEYLNNSDRKDILLINRSMYKKELDNMNIGKIMFLTEDNTGRTSENCSSVFKYQHAEKLITEITRLHAENCLRAIPATGNCKTRFICVFSPAGGTGTSSITSGLSILSAGRGLKTFYLNLENVPSTSLYFQCENEKSSFSNVIYNLKGKGGNLGMKLEGVKSCDPRNGVNFFSQPDNILEMEELTAQDISKLITEFKAFSSYDIVFIDMSSNFDKRTAAVFDAVDMILMVVAPGEHSTVKANNIKTGFEILGQKYGINFSGKLYTIFNRCNKKIMNFSTAENATGKSSASYGAISAGSTAAYGNETAVGKISDASKVCSIEEVIAEIGDYPSITKNYKLGTYLKDNQYNEVLIKNVHFMSDLNILFEYILTQGVAPLPEYGGGGAIG